MRLILARHGETDWNQQRLMLGLSDIGLNELGRRQAESLALALKNQRVETIYSSPLKRARETAAAISRCHGLEVVILDGLKELDAGGLDGLTYEEMASQYPDFLAQWLRDAGVPRPGGESLAQLQDRAGTAIEGILQRHQGVVVVVSHYFVILCTIARALGLALSDRRLRLDVAAISILDFSGPQPVLTLFNDTCHLGREI